MSIFGFSKNKPLKAVQAQEQDAEETFVVADLVPSEELTMTPELMRRQREEELRRAYCNPSQKTGVMP